MAFQSKSLSNYNKVSESQLKVALKFLPELLIALKNAEKVSQNTINIVDYGCSEGKNSLTTFFSLFSSFRETSSKPISVLHADLPENN